MIVTAAPAACRVGSGHLVIAHSDNASAVVSASASAPLVWLTPVTRGPAAWAYAGTYGGGLLAGDVIDTTVTVGADARLVLATQASTKIYRSDDGRWAENRLSARVEAEALLVSAPDPVTCFAGARLRQDQCFELAPTASLALIDWMGCGRAARGEHWALADCRNRLCVRVDGRDLLRDAMHLRPPQLHERLGRFAVFGTLLLVGPALRTAAAHVLDDVAQTPVTRDAALLTAASPLGDGVVLRFAAAAIEPAHHLLRRLLAGLADALNDPRWHRRW